MTAGATSRTIGGTEVADVTPVYRVGPLMIDAARRLVTVGVKTYAVPEKLFELLAILIEGDGQLVEREVFFAKIWGDDQCSSDANLRQLIFMLRRTLRDIAGDDTLIVTVPGQGYRFALPVERKIGLTMKASCERCATRLSPMDDAAICSFECTYCRDCAGLLGGRCSRCGGRLERRPTRASQMAIT
jgi:DNA-binding winged helix-turn-helix (wHTH) protein